MFEKVPSPDVDPLYRVVQAFTEDKRSEKIDLGVGVYKDANGHASTMRCVAQAEHHLSLIGQTKAYLPQSGEPSFIEGMTALLFGDRTRLEMARLQTIGGTGGVRLALEAVKLANPGCHALLGIPSWPNHAAICSALNIPVQTFSHRGDDTAKASISNAMEAVDGARTGDILILHGPCHNPTGLDYSQTDLLGLLDAATAKGVVPLIDAAYYGLGNELSSDLEHLRALLDRTPEALLVMSCSKAFGLYRDRIGILFAKTRSNDVASDLQAALQVIARVSYSGPAAHGGEVVGRILSDEESTSLWLTELAEMRDRLASIRSQIARLGKELPALREVKSGRGIFAMLPLTAHDTRHLADEHAIFMPESGRLNLAGLRDHDVGRFVEVVSNCLKK